MKLLFDRNPTGYLQSVPLKEDGLPDYAKARIWQPEEFVFIARILGFRGSMIPMKTGKAGMLNAVTDFLNGKIGTKYEGVI